MYPLDRGRLRLRDLRVGQADRRVRFERTLKPELSPDFAHGRHDLLAEQADAGQAIFMADVAVDASERHDAWPCLLEDATQLRNDHLRGAGDDHHVFDLLLEARAAAR